jgi:Ca2+/Na+ antiporter
MDYLLASLLFLYIYVLICTNILSFVRSFRLSFVTEQVAEHTNGTIGALLNATFGNAPELLIATAALRQGFYRVVQLAMLGSMLTNLLFVFGLASLVGGLRWQVQELRITSGNVSVGMLLLSVAGSLLPAALVLSGQLRQEDGDAQAQASGVPSQGELKFCRVNAFVMMFMYGCYLTFQLGTHKEEFDEEENVVETPEGHQLHMSPHFTSRYGRQNQNQARRNMFCMRMFARMGFSRPSNEYQPTPTSSPAGGGNAGDVEMPVRDRLPHRSSIRDLLQEDDGSANGIGVSEDQLSTSSGSSQGSGHKLLPQNEAAQRENAYANGYFDDYNELSSSHSESDSARRRRTKSHINPKVSPRRTTKGTIARLEPGHLLPLGLADPLEPLPPRKFFSVMVVYCRLWIAPPLNF